MSSITIGEYYDSERSMEIHQAFWDVANIHERANTNLLVKEHLMRAQMSLHHAWKLQTHMNELGEFEKRSK
jgi:hypothetical protein